MQLRTAIASFALLSLVSVPLAAEPLRAHGSLAAGHAVSCLVPGVDWNPKTWESC